MKPHTRGFFYDKIIVKGCDDMLEAIKSRVSVRTYATKKLTSKHIESIQDIIHQHETMMGPFEHHIKLYFYEHPFIDSAQKMKIGTYGFIVNPYSFVVGIVENTMEGIIDYGYMFESIILELTSIGLGTVWLGGSFNRDVFSGLKEDNEVIPAITPVGYPQDKKSMREVLIRRVSKGDLRKPVSELFFLNSFDTPLPEAHEYTKLCEYVRIAPSASNKQPWRFIVKQQDIHVYLERTKGYGDSLPYDIQALDIGIAIKHLEISLKAHNYSFEWHRSSEIHAHSDLVYIGYYHMLT